MKPVAPPSAGHKSARILVHDHDLSALHHVLLVLLIEAIGPQKLGNGVNSFAPELKITLSLILALPLFIVRSVVSRSIST